jgi:uncharacterized protein with GYD domain
VPADSPNPFGEQRHRPAWLRRPPRAPRSEPDPSALRLLVSAPNEIVAAMICAKLADAGIPSVQEKSNDAAAIHAGLDASGVRRVHVRAGDLARAKELIDEDAPSEQELAELSARGFEELTGRPAPADD